MQSYAIIMKYVQDISKTFLARLDPFGSYYPSTFLPRRSDVPREDVEIPSANLRTPYMYDAAQERWAGDSEILKMASVCLGLCSIWGFWGGPTMGDTARYPPNTVGLGKIL